MLEHSRNKREECSFNELDRSNSIFVSNEIISLHERELVKIDALIDSMNCFSLCQCTDLIRWAEREFCDASQHVDRALDHRAEPHRRLFVPVQIHQILPQQRHVHVLHVHQLDRARHRPRVLVSVGHDDREVAREDQHEQHHLDQVAVRLESLVVARALHHVVGPVQRATRHHVRRITKRVDLATDQVSVHAAREKHVVRGDGLPSAGR